MPRIWHANRDPPPGTFVEGLESIMERTETSPMAGASLAVLPQSPPSTFWYKDAVIYQLHVRAFFDSNGNGIGDFRGLASKLDYLQDLGVTALWLLPFYPSPLKDDGYDIADYKDVHPDYGTLREFKHFLREAHERGLRVITELVLNHTSDQHPWFQRARRSRPGSRWREFYVWSDMPDKYRQARIIFTDFESSNWSWDPVARAYYWHRFYSHQPDLNFDNPEVRQAMFDVVDYWLGMGVDGLRLDAVPYLYEREGTNCENLPETHAYLRELRRHVDERFEGRMLLAEANQWPEDAVAYFGSGDECHAAFHFPVMPRMYMSVQMEDRFPIIDILQQTPAIPANCQWMMFLRNHDELTLEMVTDEERDYMYRFYARDPRARINLGIRRRLAPLMQKDRRKIELLNALLMSLPGTPIIYYGDEIGMGDNIYLGDRNGVRTPMQWSADRNAGFSTANPQQLYLPPIIDYEYHYETVNVENQTRNPSSLLNWMKRIISIRKRHPALANGSLEFLYPENPRVLAFLRRSAGETVLVVANLSRLAQFAELDLSAFRGCVPLELFGRSLFPRVGELPYLLTLTPYAFFWFALCPRQEAPLRVGDGDGRPGVVETEVPVLSVSGEWDDILRGPARRALEQALPRYLRERRWFAGKPRAVQSARIADAIHLRELKQPIEGYFVLVDVDYADAEPQTCLIPLGFGSEEQFETLGPHAAHRVVARMEVERNGFHQTGMLYDLVGDEDFSQALLEIIGSRRTFQGAEGAIHGRPSSAFRRLRGPADEPLKTTVLKGEQGGSQVVYGDRFLLKLFRRVEQGINPDVEIGMYLADQAGFPHTPPVAGTIEYRVPDHLPATLAVLQGYIPNQGTAWDYSLKSAAGYFERILADLSASPSPQDTAALPMLVELAGAEIPPAARQRIGPYLQSVELLGRRTAELHIALSAEAEDRAFAPEPFSKLYQRSLYQAARHQAVRSLELLARRLEVLPEEDRGEAQRLLGRREDLIRRLHRLVGREIVATRIRCHGDYRLGQVLFTGDDFVIMNFEGELAQPLSQRRIKTSPFRDVAGMLCSFDYACRAALEARIAGLVVPESDYAILEQWVRFWVGWTSAAFLRAYLEAAEGQAFVPRPRDAVQTLLDVYLMEKYLEELQYELNNRPDWAWIPLQGVWRILSQTE